MSESYNFYAVIPWRVLETHLKKRLDEESYKLRRAKGEEIQTHQGRAQVLEELLNLPKTLELTIDEREQK